MMTIMKEGELVSVAPTTEPKVLELDPRWPGVERLDCYYFPQLKLEPPVVWKVMAGAALGRFFDRCVLQISEDQDVEVRYAHGRSEVMRGKPYISTVLLVHVSQKEPISQEKWVSYLPAIYEEFMRKYDPSQKKA